MPLGSVVELKGSIRKKLIVTRGVSVKTKDGYQPYVYGGCDYPEGMLKSELTYFNTEDVSTVIGRGYTDESEAYMQKLVYSWCNGGDN